MWVPHFRPSSLVPPTGELQTVLLVPPPTPAKEFGNIVHPLTHLKYKSLNSCKDVLSRIFKISTV